MLRAVVAKYDFTYRIALLFTLSRTTYIDKHVKIVGTNFAAKQSRDHRYARLCLVVGYT